MLYNKSTFWCDTPKPFSIVLQAKHMLQGFRQPAPLAETTGKNKLLLTLDINNVWRYYLFMIISYKDKETEKIWNQVVSKKLPIDIQKIALRKLFIINHAINLLDLNTPPSNRLEKLKGNRVGQYSIRINDQWRICFKWHENNAHDVEIVDYH